MVVVVIFFFKQKTAYEMRISDWSSDVCSSDLVAEQPGEAGMRVDGDVADLLGPVGGPAQPGDAQPAGAGRPADGRRLRRVERDHREIGRASCRERVCPYV